MPVISCSGYFWGSAMQSRADVRVRRKWWVSSLLYYDTPVPNKWLGHSRENACKRQKLIDFNMLPFYEKRWISICSQWWLSRSQPTMNGNPHPNLIKIYFLYIGSLTWANQNPILFKWGWDFPEHDLDESFHTCKSCHPSNNHFNNA